MCSQHKKKLYKFFSNIVFENPLTFNPKGTLIFSKLPQGSFGGGFCPQDFNFFCATRYRGGVRKRGVISPKNLTFSYFQINSKFPNLCKDSKFLGGTFQFRQLRGIFFPWKVFRLRGGIFSKPRVAPSKIFVLGFHVQGVPSLIEVTGRSKLFAIKII